MEILKQQKVALLLALQLVFLLPLLTYQLVLLYFGRGSLADTGGISTLSSAHGNTHYPVMSTFISLSIKQSPYQPTGK